MDKIPQKGDRLWLVTQDRDLQEVEVVFGEYSDLTGEVMAVYRSGCGYEFGSTASNLFWSKQEAVKEIEAKLTAAYERHKLRLQILEEKLSRLAH